jgi:hypothetical protein
MPTITINGLPACQTCHGTRKLDVPGCNYQETCEDCQGSGVDSEIPEAIAFDEDFPEYVNAFLSEVLSVDPLEEAISLLRTLEREADPFCGIADDQPSGWKKLYRARVYLEKQRRVA